MDGDEDFSEEIYWRMGTFYYYRQVDKINNNIGHKKWTLDHTTSSTVGPGSTTQLSTSAITQRITQIIWKYISGEWIEESEPWTKSAEPASLSIPTRQAYNKAPLTTPPQSQPAPTLPSLNVPPLPYLVKDTNPPMSANPKKYNPIIDIAELLGNHNKNVSSIRYVVNSSLSQYGNNLIQNMNSMQLLDQNRIYEKQEK